MWLRLFKVRLSVENVLRLKVQRDSLVSTYIKYTLVEGVIHDLFSVKYEVLHRDCWNSRRLLDSIYGTFRPKRERSISQDEEATKVKERSRNEYKLKYDF